MCKNGPNATRNSQNQRWISTPRHLKTSEKVPEAGSSQNTQHLIGPLQPRPQSGATCWTGVGQHLKESQAPFPPEFLNSPSFMALVFPGQRPWSGYTTRGGLHSPKPLIYVDSSDPLVQSAFSLFGYSCKPLQPPEFSLSVYYSNSSCLQASHGAQNIQALARLSEVSGSKSFPSLTCTRPRDASPVQPLC